MLRFFNPLVKKPMLVVVIGILLSFYSFSKNGFSAERSGQFENFDKGSESLVLGKVIADREQLPVPGGFNLAFTTIQEKGHNLQSYSLINNSQFPDLTIQPDDINDDNWVHGIARNFSGFVTQNTPNELAKYEGRKVLFSNGEQRVIKFVEVQGRYIQVHISGSALDGKNVGYPNKIAVSGNTVEKQNYYVEQYISQFGLQGKTFSYLYNEFGLNLKYMHKLNALLLALSVTVLAFQYARFVGKEFAVVLFFSLTLSPWIVLYARSLYWVSFLWFLPALIAFYYYFSNGRSAKLLASLFFYLSVLAKCLCGYEFISTIIWFAAAIFIIDQFLTAPRFGRVEATVHFFALCITGVLAFISALLIHASTRGATILEGLRHIYEYDVLKRTYGDPAVFSDQMFRLSYTPWQVVKAYFFDWKTEFVPFVDGKYFMLIILACMATLVYKFWTSHPTRYRDLAIISIFSAGPISWFILAKGHSAVHTHMNFVLMYFGFAAALIFVLYNGMRILFLRGLAPKVSDWMKSADWRMY